MRMVNIGNIVYIRSNRSNRNKNQGRDSATFIKSKVTN